MLLVDWLDIMHAPTSYSSDSFSDMEDTLIRQENRDERELDAGGNAERDFGARKARSRSHTTRPYHVL